MMRYQWHVHRTFADIGGDGLRHAQIITTGCSALEVLQDIQKTMDIDMGTVTKVERGDLVTDQGCKGI